MDKFSTIFALVATAAACCAALTEEEQEEQIGLLLGREKNCRPSV